MAARRRLHVPASTIGGAGGHLPLRSLTETLVPKTSVVNALAAKSVRAAEREHAHGAQARAQSAHPIGVGGAVRLNLRASGGRGGGVAGGGAHWRGDFG